MMNLGILEILISGAVIFLFILIVRYALSNKK